MPRYIDADALKAEMSEECPDDKMVQLIVMIFNACVDNAPTADVRENVRGKWIKDSDTAFYWECSECGAYLFWRKEEYLLRSKDETNFCPNCGADMRTGE